jgi:LSD1 subclass zinc finger protein
MSTRIPFQVELSDIVRLRKKHPCGSYEWEVVRLGADIGLVCQGCRRRVLLPRGEFNKRVKQLVNRTVAENSGDSPGG